MQRLYRILALLLALLLLAPSAMAEDTLRGYDKKQGYVYLTLGTFPQTAEGGVEPILWRGLQVEDGRAYILSEYVLEARRIHGDYNEYANKPNAKKNPGFDGDFTQTEMAQYLNGDFTAHFTSAELALLSPDETLGMFTLLSSDELKDKNLGFSKDNDRKAWGTEYAKANGLFVYGSSRGNHSPYWSRTQSSTNRQGARCIKSKGEQCHHAGRGHAPRLLAGYDQGRDCIRRGHDGEPLCAADGAVRRIRGCPGAPGRGGSALLRPRRMQLLCQLLLRLPGITTL